ncbi:MAG: class B sortase [Lachnospiraceae bacterium]|nr:class B sortase [Lachnospiraceae bacterium]
MIELDDLKDDKIEEPFQIQEVKKVSNQKKKKTKKVKKIAYNVAMIVLICIFVGSASYLINYYWQAKKVDSKSDELKDMIVDNVDEDIDTEKYEEVESVIDDDGNKVDYVYINGVKCQKKFAIIYEKNNDFIGWLTLDGTVIDYPVMQTINDEEYYLHRDFDGKYNGNGTLFADTDSNIEKPSDNILIYGHNMKNGRMFHEILNYADENYYNEHKYIQFDTIYCDGKYEVIAAFTTKIYDVDYTGFKYYNFFEADSEEEFNYFVESCKNLTNYDIPVTASYGDKLITLSTCATSDDAGRFVVVAKKIE